MPSPFDACLRATNHVFDRVGGEDFRLIPQAAPPAASGRGDVNARPVAAAVGPVPFRAIFYDRGTVLHARGRSMADSTTRPIAAEEPFLDYAVEDLPGRASHGDVIERPKTGARYTVAQDTEADLGRRHIRLTEIRATGTQG